jgi:DHA3 family macrolide efflux protein-like MFS transporter
MNETHDLIDSRWKRNATLFIGGQALSTFGSMLVQYAVMWHVTLKTQSGTMMTLFALAAMLPVFIISPFGGVWADRYNRKYLINIADASIALVTLVMAVLFFIGLERIELLLVCSVARGFGQGIQTPAVSALIPQLVPEDKLVKFNGFNGGLQSLCMFAAPMLSGALMSFAPIEAVLMIDVVTAAIGIAIVFFFVKVPPVIQKSGADTGWRSYFRDMKEGLHYIRNSALLRQFFLIAAVFSVMIAPAAMMSPLQVTRNFGAEVWRLTAIELTFSAGMMLGGLLLGLWGGFKNKAHTIAAATCLFGLESFALGLLGNFWIYLALMVVMGVTLPLFSTPGSTLLQTKTDPAYMGRVFSIMTMIQSVMMPAAMIVFGPLADAVNINWLFIGSGTVLFILGFFVLGSRALRAAGK